MKLLLCLFAIIIISSKIYSQQIEIRTGAGYLSDAQISEAIGNGISNFFTAFFGGSNNFRIITSGIYSGDALISIRKNVKLGLSYSYENLKIKYYYSNDTFSVSNRYINTVMPCIYFTLFRQSKFSVYASTAVGIRFSAYSKNYQEKRNKTTFAYDFVIPGFRYGNKFSGFLEAGFGTKGLIRGGVSYSF